MLGYEKILLLSRAKFRGDYRPALSYERVAVEMEDAVPVEAGKESQAAGSDNAALEYAGTTFLFEGGYFSGSKADLPSH